RSNPKFEIRVNRILHHNRNVYAFECVSYFLYGEWVYSRTRTDPQNINAGLEACVNVSSIGYFSCDGQTRFYFGLSKPTQSFNTCPFVLPGTRSRLPDSGTQSVYFSRCSQLFGCHDRLFFRFRTARTTNDNGLVLCRKPR